MGRLRLVPRSPFLAIPVLSVIVLSLARPALAQVPDLETFRRELAQVLVDLDQQRAVLKQTDLVKNARTQSRFDSAPPLSAVQLQLQQMTYEDLARVHDAFATAFPGGARRRRYWPTSSTKFAASNPRAKGPS
jgi:uncharacterized protein YcgI (DUF1989 family)